MEVIEVNIQVEEQQLSACSLQQRLLLFFIYSRMALHALCGKISRIKIAPVYGGGEPEPDVSDYKGK
jgi:hypothetical protein